MTNEDRIRERMNQLEERAEAAHDKWSRLREKVNERIKGVTSTKNQLVNELADAVSSLRIACFDDRDPDGLVMLRADEIRRVCAIIATLEFVKTCMDELSKPNSGSDNAE